MPDKSWEENPIWKEISERGPEPGSWQDPDWSMNQYKKRRDFTKNYAWAVPDKNAIAKIKDFVGGGKVLEIGAGTGLWAKLLRDAGVRVTPSDLHPWGSNYDTRKKSEKEYVPIWPVSQRQALKAWGWNHDTLLLVWPPYGSPLAANALKGFKGDKLIYVGEGSGGCTANDDFHNMLEEDWDDVGYTKLPQWEGIHDCLSFYKRKKKPNQARRVAQKVALKYLSSFTEK